MGQETPMTASKRPDSHQCCAVLSCLVFPPLEIFALVHSIMTYRSWNQGNYGNAVDHSRQAYIFAWWGVAFFVVYVVYRFFADGTSSQRGGMVLISKKKYFEASYIHCVLSRVYLSPKRLLQIHRGCTFELAISTPQVINSSRYCHSYSINTFTHYYLTPQP